MDTCDHCGKPEHFNVLCPECEELACSECGRVECVCSDAAVSGGDDSAAAISCDHSGIGLPGCDVCDVRRR